MYTGKIIQTTKRYTRTESGKTWKRKPDDTTTAECNEQNHENATSPDTSRFFRRLGGVETITRGYTAAGYKVIRVSSTSPDRQHKTVREYTFNY